MKFSYNWLRDYVDFETPVEELVDLLSASGTKFESMHKLGAGIDGVVVAEVVEIADHPNADNLYLVDVSVVGNATQRVVCGVRNFAKGDLVPYATIGSRLPGMEIGERKIRGEVSAGMLCSPRELGLSEDHSGILVLPRDLELGHDVVDALHLDDAIVEVEVTPNRGDCMGMIGIAREVAALVGGELQIPDAGLTVASGLDVPVLVDIQDPQGCRRFTARYLDNLASGSSPGWMQSRLVALGVRPISNVVDITNYVMLETGQPLHAFDATKIRDRTIVVRRARDGELLTTLDGLNRTMHPDDLMIADPDRAVSIAGIMGGEDSEVAESTTEVILEVACFDSTSITYTSRRHLLRSEASARFERGTDPELPPYASARAAKLMAEIAGARISEAFTDENPRPWTPATISLRPARTSAVLGYAIEPEEQGRHLRSVGLEAVESNGELSVRVPSYRAADITREVDLIEEVARLAGFDRLPATLPPGSAGALEPAQATERRIARILSGLGLAEARTGSFGSPAELDALGFAADHPARAMVELENPTSDDQPCLRTTLLPGLLTSAARNVAQHADSIGLYEIAPAYFATGEQLPDERLMLGAVFSGLRAVRSWARPAERWDFFSAKGILEALVSALEIEPAAFEPLSALPFHPTRGAGVALSGTALGVLGQLHPDVCARFELPDGVVAFEIMLAPLLAAGRERVKIDELSRFPAIYRDLALVVDDRVAAAMVEDLVRRAGAPEVTSVRLFDMYTGEQVPAGKKSLAYALELRSRTQTLTDADADRVRDRIITALRERTGAELRS